jgi:cytoskeleton protein RodZ
MRRTDRQVGSGHWAVRLVSVGILALLAALAFVWWQSEPPGDEPDSADTGTTQETVPERRAPVPVVEDTIEIPAAPTPAETLPRTQTAEPERPQAPSSAEQQPPAATVEEASAPENAVATEGATAESDTENTAENGEEEAAAGAGEILMTFDGPCWVDVRDSERKFKLFGEMKKGDRHILEGKPPYSVILGNAAAVQITVDGAAFDLSALSQGNVARFTLDPSELP